MPSKQQRRQKALKEKLREEATAKKSAKEAAEQAAKAAKQGIGHSTAWSHHCSHRSRCHAGPGPLSLTEDGAGDSVDMGTNVVGGWKARCRRPSLDASGHGAEAEARAASGDRRLGRGAKRRRELKAGALCEYCRVLIFVS